MVLGVVVVGNSAKKVKCGLTISSWLSQDKCESMCLPISEKKVRQSRFNMLRKDFTFTPCAIFAKRISSVEFYRFRNHDHFVLRNKEVQQKERKSLTEKQRCACTCRTDTTTSDSVSDGGRTRTATVMVASLE